MEKQIFIPYVNGDMPAIKYYTLPIFNPYGVNNAMGYQTLSRN